MDIKKREDEIQNEYIARIYRNKSENGLTNNMCKDVINKELGTEYAEPTLRGIAKTWNECADYITEKVLKDKSTNDEIEELEEKRKELEKEKVRYQDQKREYQNYLRADARFEHLKNEISKSISELKEFKPFVVKEVNNNIKTESSLLLSDWHTGLKEKNYWNEISIDILKDRIEYLQNKVISICKLHNVQVLHVEILNDMINGLIHVSTRISNEEDVISQTMICCEILSNLLYNLSKEIPNIKVYSSLGNHGRCVANKTESIDTEDFERLLPWYLKQRLINIKNIEFCDNYYDEGIIVYKFLNETIFAVHGHNDKVGTVINDLSQMLKVFPTEVHMGHYHSYYEKDNHNISIVINGCASGVDKYAKNIRKTGSPNQVCMIYTEKGRECTYKIKL